ncbi:MAG: efflux RND transporter permease subunit [Planctomycetes bacterium]|nr:efflux RND transporter permease subunit [Planctomycetota bacterium]
MSENRMGGTIRMTLRRPVTIMMLLCSTILIGILAQLRIPIELLPSGFVMPTVSINIPFPGANPVEVEEQITKPTEEVLRQISGLEEIRTRSSKDFASITIRFARGVDSDESFAEVRDLMEVAKLSWPDQVQEYSTFRFNLDTDLPVFSFGILIDEMKADTSFLLDEKIIKEIESVDGVARVNAWGIVENTIRIFVDRARAQAAGVSLFEIAQAMSADNRDVIGGRIEDAGQHFYLRSEGRFRDLEEVRDWPVRADLRLREIATVEEVGALRNSVFRLEGKRSVWFMVNKESSANTVEVCKRIRARLDERIAQDERIKEEGWGWFRPEDQDFGLIIQKALSELIRSALLGGLLALVPLFLFLRRLRMTLIITLSIPISLMIALACIYFTGGTLNILSMMGITIAIGMLVDNTIVVVENIFRHRQMGLDARAAALTGTSEVALAVTLATLTTVVAFVPIIFMGGGAQTSFFTKAIGLPVCYAVLASLAVALVFIPLATAFLYRKGHGAARPSRLIDGALHGLNTLHQRCLTFAVDNRFAALLIIVLASYGTTRALWGRISMDPTSEESSGSIEVDVELESNFTLLDADGVFRQIQGFIDERRDDLHLKFYYYWFRNTGGTFKLSLDNREPELARVVIEEIDQGLNALAIAGARIRIGIERQNEEQTTIQLRVFGSELERLHEVCDDVRDRIEVMDQVASVKGGVDRGEDEIIVTPDRERMQLFGVDPRALMGTVQYGIRGQRLPDFHLGDQKLQMIIEFDESAETSVADLKSMGIWSRSGSTLPLNNLADLYFRRGYGTITKTNGKLGAMLTIEPEVGAREAVGERVREFQAEYPLPPGYSFKETSGEEAAAEKREIMNAALLSAVLILLLMGVLFESLLLPLAVFTTIPFALLGAWWTLSLTRTSLDFVGMIGAIVLIGIVVNNAIVFLDCAHGLVRTGVNRRQAILEAGSLRLRPIFMTTATTVVGLLPMALSKGTGSFVSYTALARGVIGGLMVSTVATLIVVPVFYALLSDLRRLCGDTVRSVLGLDLATREIKVASDPSISEVR